jgi:ATP synthase protein I
MILAQSKALRTVLRWQVIATAAMTLLLGLLAGVHGAISAGLGGLVSICAGLAFSVVVSSSKPHSLAGTLVTALRAEAIKVAVAVILLWLVFATYENVVAIGFVGSFALSILVFGMAFFVRDASHPARESSD